MSLHHSTDMRALAHKQRKSINQAPTASDHFHAVILPYVTQPQEKRIADLMTHGHDYTIGELSWLTKLDKSTVSARRYAMLHAADPVIERGPRRKCKFSDIFCETVKLKEN